MTGPLIRAGDWLARTTMLVLAALATLALIGSLASVSNSPIGNAFPGSAPPAAEGAPSPAVPASNPQIVEPGQGTMTLEAPPLPRVAAATAPASPNTDEVVRWLKALTYAVIALAVFAAAGVVALVRIAGYLRGRAER